MKRRRAPLERAVTAARGVLSNRGIATPEEIDLAALLADFRIALRRAPIGNAEGRLVRAGRRGVITIDERSFDSEKWRFVLAHELGHFLLHVIRADLLCFPKKGAAREDKGRIFLDEQAASDFAAELLLPDAMVRERYDAAATPMDRARGLASTFGVSLPTAALRTLDFTEEPCAVAYVEAGVVEWCTATKAFGVAVPKKVNVATSEGAREAAHGYWGEVAKGIGRVHEHTVALAPFDASVTMLWHERVDFRAISIVRPTLRDPSAG
jgi:IrrE N-terminal-like domain